MTAIFMRSSSPEIRQGGRESCPVRHPFDRFAQYRLQGAEPEVLDQLPQASLGLREIAVMPEPAEQPDRQSRLVRVDLPRVQIENGAPVFLLVDAIEPPPRPSVREEPEVPPTPDREIPAAHAHGGPWGLDQHSGLAPN